MPTFDIANFPDTVKAFDGNEQRATVFLDRYAKKNHHGKPDEHRPAEMWLRVAAAVADDTEQAQRFSNLLQDFKFVPGGRILSGAGVDAEVTFYNCYVIPVETKARRKTREFGGPTEGFLATDTGSDSREAIFDTIGLMVDIMSRGGGVGINWSVLRPKGAYLKRVNGTTSGPVSWMDVASRAVGVVEQGGSRRGAAMFMLDDWHPDIEEFIEAKRDFSKITNANISVAISDAFMQAVENDTIWVLAFPDTNHPAYNSEWDGDIVGWYQRYGPGSVVDYKEVRARDLWRKMSESAWASGEPGLVFLDRYNKMRTASYTGEGVMPTERIISVNPCGEQGLEPYAVCNLGAMNLAAYVAGPRKRGHTDTHGNTFDWDAFSKDAADAIEFLDNVIDKNYYFIPENEDIQKRLRRVGLGVMGLADALIALNMRYGSAPAIEFTERVFRTMKQAAVSRSTFLAERKGAAPGWNSAMLRSPYLAEFADTKIGERLYRYGLRNLFLLTQAPTGTTSILAGVNSGIEPYFAFEYTRKDRTGTHKVVHPIAEKLKDRARQMWPDYYVESGQVTVEEHIAMQAAAQRYVDSSISKTINGPTEHTVEDVEKAYWMAYESGLKGIAYFRDGSGRDQVLYKEEPKAKDEALQQAEEKRVEMTLRVAELEAELAAMHELVPYAVEFSRPATLSGETTKVRTKAGTAYVTVNRDAADGSPVEVFLNVGKAGSDIMELGEAIGRLASLALRHGASLGGVAHQLTGIGGNGKFNKPLVHAIGETLTAMNSDREEEEPVNTTPLLLVTEAVNAPAVTQSSQSISGQMCPECHNFTVALEEGCKKCMSCGWSAC